MVGFKKKTCAMQDELMKPKYILSYSLYAFFPSLPFLFQTRSHLVINIKI